MPTVITARIRFAPDHIDRVKAAAADMTRASQAEGGCIDYAFSQDVCDPNVFRVVEIWDDDDALKRHFQMPHMATFNAVLADCPPVSLQALRHVSGDTAPLNIANFRGD